MLKETTELVMCGIGFMNAAGKAKADDGKYTVGDLTYFLVPMGQIPSALDGADKISDELKARTAEDTNALLTEAKQRFDLPDDEIEEFVEDAVAWALATARLGQRGVVLWQKKTA